MNTETTALPWPRLTRNEAQARNLLAQRALACPLELAGQVWQLDVQPWPPGQGASPPPPQDWHLRLDWGGARFDLWLPASAAQTWMAASEPGLDLPTLPEAFAAAALEDALAAALAALAGLQRGAARLESLSRVGDEAGSDSSSDGTGPHRFGLRLTQGEAVVHGALAADTLGLMLIAGLAAQRPAQANALDEDRLPVPLLAAIGSARLSVGELDGLRPGDAVLLERTWLDADGGLWLLAGDLGVRVRWNDGGLTVTQTATPIGLAMPEPEAESMPAPAPEPVAEKPADAPPDWSSLPVLLTFDLGERTLTLGEIKSLQVGQSLELARPLEQAVHIRANGALIGSGELVEIDGRLAVGIASLAFSAKAAP